MADEKNSNGGTTDRDADNPHALTLDINDWTHAGKRILGVINGIGRIVPPLDRYQATELTGLIDRADEQFERLVEIWEDHIRPRLKKYELPDPPPWVGI